MLYVAIRLDKPDSFHRRDQVRRNHLAFIEADMSRVKIDGPFLDAEGPMNGSALSVEAADEAEARASFRRSLCERGPVSEPQASRLALDCR